MTLVKNNTVDTQTIKKNNNTNPIAQNQYKKVLPKYIKII